MRKRRLDRSGDDLKAVLHIPAPEKKGGYGGSGEFLPQKREVGVVSGKTGWCVAQKIEGGWVLSIVDLEGEGLVLGIEIERSPGAERVLGYVDVARERLGEFLTSLPSGVSIVGTGELGASCRFVIDVTGTGYCGGEWAAKVEVTPVSRTVTWSPVGAG